MATVASEPGTGQYQLIGRLFIRGLALVYLVAFASLAVQITGLAGSQGIYPIAESLRDAAHAYGAARFWRFPTLFWFWSSDAALQAVAWAGCALSLILLLSGRAQRPLLIGLFLLYLSLFHAGRVFMNFQWEYLLLEAGFLAILLPSAGGWVIWLFRWLLFRLRFLSGISKLTSGDPGWLGLIALNHYFETQPIPHLGAWYAHQLPDWLLRFGTGATLFVELIVPFFFLLPRRWRIAGASLTLLWQLLILLTSNHNYFNLLTILLCLFLIDDRALRWLLPGFLYRWLARSNRPEPRPTPKPLVAGFAVYSLLIAVLLALPTIVGRQAPEPFFTGLRYLAPLRLVGNYHVFPTIERSRVELVLEGSLDGIDWREYRFRFRVDAPDEMPPIVMPHHPRVDWMMWFVPSSPLFLDWFQRFVDRLLQGSPQVLALLAENPFPTGPPKFIRVTGYRYRFTTRAEHAATDDWWVREHLGPFPPLPGRRRL